MFSEPSLPHPAFVGETREFDGILDDVRRRRAHRAIAHQIEDSKIHLFTFAPLTLWLTLHRAAMH